MERRSFKTELRTEKAGGKMYLIGRAASYGVVSHDLGGWREVLAPGAFDDALADPQLNCKLTLGHDQNQILGRTSSGTLELEANPRGLYYRAELPDTSCGRDVSALCGRGDLSESSFGFSMTDRADEDWTKDTEDPDNPGERVPLRTINRIGKLHDVAVVGDGAYPQTAAGISDRALPASMPAEIRARILQRAENDLDDLDPDDLPDDAEPCACGCAECKAGNCDDCEDENCTDENCRCEQSMRSAHAGGDDGKDTKTVDGEELPQSAFLIHGESDDKTTWKLPVRFSTLAKSEKHVRLAIDLFDTLEDVPEDEKARARKELEALAKKYGIEIDDEDDRAARELDLELATLD